MTDTLNDSTSREKVESTSACPASDNLFAASYGSCADFLKVFAPTDPGSAAPTGGDAGSLTFPPLRGYDDGTSIIFTGGDPIGSALKADRTASSATDAANKPYKPGDAPTASLPEGTRSYDVASPTGVSRSAHTDENGRLQDITSYNRDGSVSTRIDASAWSGLESGQSRTLQNGWQAYRMDGTDGTDPNHVRISNRDGTAFTFDLKTGKLASMERPGSHTPEQIWDTKGTEVSPGVRRFQGPDGRTDYNLGAGRSEVEGRTDASGRLSEIHAFVGGIGTTMSSELWKGLQPGQAANNMPAGWHAFRDFTDQGRTVISHDSGATFSLGVDGRLLVMHPPGTNMAPHFLRR